MNLIQGETILMQSDKNILTLTTHRVRKETKFRGTSTIVSMTVESVASCEVVSSSFPLLLVLGVLSAVVGVVLLPRDGGAGGVGVFLGIAMLVAYLLTRTAVLKIASAGDAIILPTKGMKPDLLVEFIDALEQQKLVGLGRISAPGADTARAAQAGVQSAAAVPVPQVRPIPQPQ